MIRVRKHSTFTILLFRILNKMFSFFINIYNYITLSIVSSRFKECGENNILDKNIWINEAQNIFLKSNIFIGKDVFLNAYDEIEIGNHCAIGGGE